MTALAANRQTVSKAIDQKSFLVEDNVHIYKGGMVSVNDSGYAVPSSDTAAHRVVGVADEEVDNTLTGHTQGGKSVRVVSGRAYKFAASSITVAMIGDIMYVVDDQTFDETTPANSVPCGRLVEFESATVGWIYIPPGGLRKASVADGTYSANETAMLNDILN